MNKLIVILGPTASGKTDLAIKLAKKYNGEVVSADSRQVYKGMDIGAGKVTEKEMQGIPHYLLNVANPKIRFTVSQYQKLALKAVKNIQKKNKLPFLTGGTGFYIQSVVDAIVIPEVKPDWKLRKNLEKKAVGLGANAIITYRLRQLPFLGATAYGTAVVVEESELPPPKSMISEADFLAKKLNFT